MKPATRVTRAGLSAPQNGDPFLNGPVFAAPFHAAGDPSESPFTYGRFHNPTWSAYEAALAELEGGPALVFGSGMAAIAAVFGTLLRPTEVALVAAESYYTTRMLATGFFAGMGVQVVLVPMNADRLSVALQQQGSRAKLLWLESPSNPSLEVCDLTALSALAHQHGVLVGVDNTTVTPLSQQPLALGADFSVASDTKAMSGHHDLILGHVAVREPARIEPLRAWRTQFGAIPGPMEVWLAHRSLQTLDVRLERSSRNALQVAQFLGAHPAVHALRYPGLPSDPAYTLASTQMRYCGPVVSFTLADRAAVERFFSRSVLVAQATSFGGLHTTAERRARWGGDAIAEGFIRMSVGIEDPDDLISDLRQALG